MRTPRYSLLLAASVLSLAGTRGQTPVPLAMAVEGPTLAASAGANDNRCAVVYNPEARLYYSMDAGCKLYPVDTYDERGMRVGTVEQGFDYRGAWWDPVTGQLEGNGYAEAGIFVQALDGTTHQPMGTGVAWHEAAQPQPHAVGTLDTEADQVIYYHDGAIHRYAHATNAPRGRLHIKELPVALSALNDNSVAYTGMSGYEYGLYDHTQRRVLFINGATGKYAGHSQLPSTAPARTTFGLSYANGYFWLFDAPSNPGTWRSYKVFGIEPLVADEAEPVIDLDEGQVVAVTAEVNELIARILAEMETVEVEAGSAVEQGAEEQPYEPVLEPAEARVSLFPVPARELLRVEMGREVLLLSVRVVDLGGREVPIPLTRTGPSAVQLDVQALLPGTYGLQVVTADGVTGHTFAVAR